MIMHCMANNEYELTLKHKVDFHLLSLPSILTLRTWGLVLLSKSLFAFSHFWNFNGYFTNTRHVCTYLNAILMIIPNMVMKFHNSDIFTSFVKFWPVVCTRPAAWKALMLYWWYHQRFGSRAWLILPMSRFHCVTFWFVNHLGWDWGTAADNLKCLVHANADLTDVKHIWILKGKKGQ